MNSGGVPNQDPFNSYSTSSGSGYKDHPRVRTEGRTCSQDRIRNCAPISRLTAVIGYRRYISGARAGARSSCYRRQWDQVVAARRWPRKG